MRFEPVAFGFWLSEVLAKAGVQNGVLKELFGRLREILRECPGWYYRYVGDDGGGLAKGRFFLVFMFLFLPPCMYVGWGDGGG